MDKKSLIISRRIRFSLIILVSQMLLIAMSIGWGVNLILIAQNGGYYSTETNPLILYGEIAATVLIIIFAFVVIYLEIVRMKSKRRNDQRIHDLNQDETHSEPIDKVKSIEDLINS